MTVVKINTGEQLKTFNHGGDIPNDKMRQCVIQDISRLYLDKSVAPTQSEIGKKLKKIKNEEVEKYYYAGYTIVTVSRTTGDNYYIYNGL